MEEALIIKENTGGYGDDGVIWHQHSNRLMIKILEYFDGGMPVVDLGCGHNWYVSVLRHFGYRATGFDMVDLGSKYFEKVDITKLMPHARFDKYNVISLEVGEHIPEHLSEKYLNNVCGFKGNIIMSWAIPGQEGIGHINCQSNKWVITEMNNRGYRLDQQKTDSLREAVKECHCSWFQNTLMYFIR